MHPGDASEAAFGPSLEYNYESGGVGSWPRNVYTTISVYVSALYASSFTDGGFYIDFSQNNASTYTMDLATLVSNNWIDSQTRAVLAHVVLYNANLNLFVLGASLDSHHSSLNLKLAFFAGVMTLEFSGSGMAYPQSQFQSFSPTTFGDFPWLYCLLLPGLLALYACKLTRSSYEMHKTVNALQDLKDQVYCAVVQYTSNLTVSF